VNAIIPAVLLVAQSSPSPRPAAANAQVKQEGFTIA